MRPDRLKPHDLLSFVQAISIVRREFE